MAGIRERRLRLGAQARQARGLVSDRSLGRGLFLLGGTQRLQRQLHLPDDRSLVGDEHATALGSSAMRRVPIVDTPSDSGPV